MNDFLKPGKVIPSSTPNKWVFTVVHPVSGECIIRRFEWVSPWLCKQAMRDHVQRHNDALRNKQMFG